MFLGVYSAVPKNGVVTMPEKFELINCGCRALIYTDDVHQAQIKILSIYPDSCSQEPEPDNICEQYDSKITNGKFTLPKSFTDYTQGEELKIYGLMNSIEIMKKSDAELMDFNLSPGLAAADSFKEIFDKLSDD